MTVWIVFAIMVAIALVLIARPLFRRPPSVSPRAEYDAQIYRDQLAEIERDRSHGVLNDDEAEAARAEIARRMLAADAADDKTESVPPPKRVHRGLGIGLGIALPVLAVGLYLDQGAPQLPDQPASARMAEREAAARIAQSDAALVDELARRMAERPDDATGWALLGRSYFSLRRFDEAEDAYRRAVHLAPQDADIVSRYGEAQTFANEGTVTPGGRLAFEAALQIDPNEPRAHYYIGLADLQAGKPSAALDRWLALEARSPPDAPWLETLRPRIDRLAERLNVDVAARRGSAAAPGPSTEDVEAAAEMTPEARAAMIESMVTGLARRLEDSPDDVQGWLRLARSYKVLGQPEKARDAYARAAQVRPDDTEILTLYASSIVEAHDGEGVPADLGPVLAAILDRNPEDRNALWLSGLAAAESGRATEARAHWTRLLALMPPGAPETKQLERRIESLPPEDG